MKVTPLALPEILLIVPDRYPDQRGHFSETYNRPLLREKAGIGDEFLQDNESFSGLAGTIRGFHFQSPPFAQDKLVRVSRGAVLDIVVDIRAGSPSYGRSASATLSAANGAQLWVPKGFAHGICTLEPDTVVIYKVTQHYSRDHDLGLAFDDPAVGADWPVAAADAIVSDKDRRHPSLAALPPYFRYSA